LNADGTSVGSSDDTAMIVGELAGAPVGSPPGVARGCDDEQAFVQRRGPRRGVCRLNAGLRTERHGDHRASIGDSPSSCRPARWPSCLHPSC
jgi:hypothetical protein